MASGLFVFSLILVNSVTIHEASVTNLSSVGEICYQNLGCFQAMNYSDNSYPKFHNVLPNSPDAVETTFFLTTRRTQNNPVVIDYDVLDTIKRVDCSKKTIFLVHGRTDNSSSQMFVDFRTAIFYMFDYNVISVDWSRGAEDENYAQPAANAQLVGRQIAFLIKTMNAVCDLKTKNVHLVGHSLGAHVCGFAGASVQTMMNQKLSRITGSDPTNIFFQGFSPDYRLDPTDADFVDVVHTTTLYGYYFQCGHVDFYVNGGIMQPGCSGHDDSHCSHDLAMTYITESVYNSCPFTSHPCLAIIIFPSKESFFTCSCNNNCGRLGYYSDTAPGRGLQFLSTNNTSPYCID